MFLRLQFNRFYYHFLDSSIRVIEPNIKKNLPSFNPYPYLGAPSLPCWPRGLPLNMIHVPMTQNISIVSKYIKFGVLQSLADIQPDVDAIYRLTKETPFVFKRPTPIPSLVEQRGELYIYKDMITICVN